MREAGLTACGEATSNRRQSIYDASGVVAGEVECVFFCRQYRKASLVFYSLIYLELCCSLSPALHLDQVFAFQLLKLLAAGAASSTCRLTPQLGPSSVLWQFGKGE